MITPKQEILHVNVYRQSRLSMDNPITEKLFKDFQIAAGKGALFELKLRLLADKTPDLKEYSHKRLFDLEEELYRFFENNLSQDDMKVLLHTRPLRNKILHGNFEAAKNKVETAVQKELPRNKVHVLKLSTDELKSVSDTRIKDSGIFGWLLESGTNGLFIEAISIFNSANEIISRLTLEESLKGLDS